MSHRKYMASAIWSGLDQMMLISRTMSMNFCESMAIRLVVSPTMRKINSDFFSHEIS